jgi:phenylacetate-coenzyme A ligase PaaK-like adenylate-forming protein
MQNNYWNKELETLPWAELEQWQTGQITDFVSSLVGRSIMYDGLLEGIAHRPLRDINDLARLPLTTKLDLRNAVTDCATDLTFGNNQSALSEDIVQAVSSSGTTGAPMYYALTRDDLRDWTNAIANTFFTAGLRPTDSIAHLVGLPGVAGGLPYADGFRAIGATTFWLGGFPTERILKEIGRLKLNTILATTSFGSYLAELVEQGNSDAKDITLEKFISGGEPGLGQPEIRAKIARGMGTDQIREVMGLGDVLSAMWSECECQDGMHFNAQKYVAIELIDPDSEDRIDWQPGAHGELVYTTFRRQATPVLRYRSRDHVEIIDTRCDCGRTSPRMRCIGRTDDMLIYKGMNVFPGTIRDLVAQRLNDSLLPQIRVWKDSKDQVRFDRPIPVDVEARPGIDASRFPQLADQVADMIRQQLQVRVAVNVVASGELPRSVYKTPLTYIKGID